MLYPYKTRVKIIITNILKSRSRN